MSEDVDAAVERARLAAEDLLAAASTVIERDTLRPEDARDDVDEAVLSRRFTSYAPSRTLGKADEDLDLANSALAEIERIAGSDRTAPGEGAEGTAATDADRIARLDALADACARRAADLRS
jgi:hypothetical protein